MGLRLSSVDSVLLGLFNPHIISPNWIAVQGILPIDANSPVELNVSFGERFAGFGVQFKLDNFIWRVGANRLTVTTQGRRNTAEVLSRVIGHLHHTPITGIGSNFRFSCPSSEWVGPFPTIEGGDDVLARFGDVKDIGWSCAFERDGGMSVRAQLNRSAGRILANVNCHRSARTPDAVGQAAKLFNEDFEVSRELLRAITRQEVAE